MKKKKKTRFSVLAWFIIKKKYAFEYQIHQVKSKTGV